MNTFDKIELLELIAEMAAESMTVHEDVAVIDAAKFLDKINQRISQYETEVEQYVLQQFSENTENF